MTRLNTGSINRVHPGDLQRRAQVPADLGSRPCLTQLDRARMVAYRRARQQRVRVAGGSLVLDDLFDERGPIVDRRLIAPTPFGAGVPSRSSVLRRHAHR
jgi:hypothetical protein